MRRKRANVWLCLIPLIIGFLFATLMFYFAVISTKKARNHYKAGKLAESVQKLGQIDFSPEWMKDENKPTPTPTPLKEKNWREYFTEYEPLTPLFILPFLVFGLYLSSMIFTSLPDHNPFDLSDLMRRSFLAMICSFALSPAILILYLWALRIGLIG